MHNYKFLLRVTWFRLLLAFVGLFVPLMIGIILVNIFLFNKMRLDISDAQRGVSRFENEIKKLEQEVSTLEKKMTSRTSKSQNIYAHYYIMYQNPLSYINKYFLTKAKPPGVIITTSSVSPNSPFHSSAKVRLKPYLSKYGISRLKDLDQIFSYVMINVSASGGFSQIAQFIQNLYELPVKFSLNSFNMQQDAEIVMITMDLSLIAYRLPDAYK